MTSEKRLSRRSFLATTATAALAAPAIVSGRNLNSKLQFAGIGADGKGYSDILQITSHERLHSVAFCDVDLSRTAKVKKKFPEAKIFQDYREMFETLGDKVDAVTVSTPDHTHAIISLDAMRRGKHVYCQKPLTRTVWEARQMRRQAKKSGVITRMGNQIHSHSAYRTTAHLIHSGAIGKVKEVHSWIAVTGHGYSGRLQRPSKKENQPAPKGLNWDLWLSVAPERPYGGNRVYHPFTWRDWQDFGSGALGDFGCHLLDPVYTALKIKGDPISVRSENTGMNNEVWPARQKVEFLLPGTEFTTGDRLKITWQDGGLQPDDKIAQLAEGQDLPRRGGSILVCEGGNLVVPHVAMPFVNLPDFKIDPQPDLNHYHGWVDGCLSGKQPSDGFEYGGHLTEAVQLGNVAAHFPKETLEFDGKKLKITNKPEANKYLTRRYRKGFVVKKV